MTSDAVSVGGAHNSPTPSELLADRFERVIAEADIRNAATARWSVREMARGPDGTQSYDNLAIYEDCLERAEGAWRFASRSYHYIWLSEAPLLGRSFPLPSRSYPSTTPEQT